MYNTRRTANRIENVVLGEIIRRLRATAGLSQREVDRRLGKTRGFLYGIEKGSSFPDIAILMDIAHILGSNIVELSIELEAEIVKHYRSANQARPYDRGTRS